MKNLLRLAILCFLLYSTTALAAGTVTEEKTFASDTLKVVTLSWACDAQAATLTDYLISWDLANFMHGWYVVMVVTDPGATAPTDDYDLTIVDRNSVDIMGGALANRDTANSEQAVPIVSTAYSPRPVIDRLTLTMSGNAVNAATGAVVIYLSK